MMGRETPCITWRCVEWGRFGLIARIDQVKKARIVIFGQTHPLTRDGVFVFGGILMLWVRRWLVTFATHKSDRLSPASRLGDAALPLPRQPAAT
jgi:hypothetical protein